MVNQDKDSIESSHLVQIKGRSLSEYLCLVS